VVFLNLVDRIREAPVDSAPLFAAWRRMAEETWNRPEMAPREAWAAVAERVALSAPEGEMRRLFRMGARLDGGGAEWVEAALAQELPALDPEPAGIRCPVRIFHGADDPVIPTGQAALLSEMIPGSKMRITGLYGHADRAASASPLALLKDGATLLAMLQALAG
jgi:pimeloyl-ACP methyl ester carboxylesterase